MNKTIYVSAEDAPIWKEARRLLAFYRDESLSAYISARLKEYVAEETARHADANTTNPRRSKSAK